MILGWGTPPSPPTWTEAPVFSKHIHFDDFLELRKRPGEWAILAQLPTPDRAQTYAKNLRLYAKGLPFGLYEVISRSHHETKLVSPAPGLPETVAAPHLYGRVWARFIEDRPCTEFVAGQAGRPQT